MSTELIQILRIDDVAKMLGFSHSHIYRMVQDREIPFYKKGKTLFFFQQDIADWIRASSKKPTTLSDSQIEIPHPIPAKYPGIRTRNGKFLVTKSIGGSRYSKVFLSMKDAIHWKLTFDPYKEDCAEYKHPKLRNVLSDYFATKGQEISLSTRTRKQKRMGIFLEELLDFYLDLITRETISKHIVAKKALITADSRRANFKKDLKDLASVLRWYHESRKEYVNPVLRSHYKEGVVLEAEPEGPLARKLSVLEFGEFISRLKSPYKEFALAQVTLGLTIAETAAISLPLVNLAANKILIKNYMVWVKSSPVYIRDCKQPIIKIISDELKKALTKLREGHSGSEFYFQRKGRPLRYNVILENYKRAMELAGLGKLTGSDIEIAA